MDAMMISQALLWIVVLALGATVFALARQIGVLYERVAPAGALAMNRAVTSGSKAPALVVETLNGKKIDIAAKSGKSRLYFFLSPSCPVCKTLLPALRSLARDERRSIEVILASDGEPGAHRTFVQHHRLEAFDYVLSELLGRMLGVAKLPYAVLVDADATIVSYGIVNSREHLDSLLEARDRGVASIQDYMTREQDSGIAASCPDHSHHDQQATGVARATS